jgi:hypothetical protein
MIRDRDFSIPDADLPLRISLDVNLRKRYRLSTRLSILTVMKLLRGNFL